MADDTPSNTCSNTSQTSNCLVCALTIKTPFNNSTNTNVNSSSTSSSSNNGIQICAACRKFFLRYRNRHLDTVRCASGNGMCRIGTNATAIGSGVVWRMACPHCRLAKCIAIGLPEKILNHNHHYNHRHNNDNNVQVKKAKTLKMIRNQQNNSNGLQSGDNDDDDGDDDDNKEMMAVDLQRKQKSKASFDQISNSSSNSGSLRQMVSAVNELARAYEKTPLKQHLKIFIDAPDAFESMILQINEITAALLKFAMSMPGFNRLQSYERDFFIKSSGASMALAVSNRSEPNPCDMAPVNATRLIAVLPEFNYSVTCSQLLHSLLKNWRPNQEEYSCLLAILLCQGKQKIIWSKMFRKQNKITNFIDFLLIIFLSKVAPIMKAAHFKAASC